MFKQHCKSANKAGNNHVPSIHFAASVLGYAKQVAEDSNVDSQEQRGLYDILYSDPEGFLRPTLISAPERGMARGPQKI
jgi:hypothetical protein